MPSLLQGGAHQEVRDIIDGSLSKLKDWLDIRLRQQEDLLRCFCNGCDCPGSPGSVKGIAFKDNTCTASKVGVSVSRIEPVTGCTDVGDVFQRVQNNNVVETQVQMIKPAMIDSSDAHSEGSLEDVPLPGSAPEPAATELAATTGSRVQSIRDSKVETKLQGPLIAMEIPDRPSRGKNRMSGEICLQDWQSKLMDIFDQLDLDRSGSIDHTEFMEAFDDVGLPQVQALDVFKSFDKTDNGSIDRLEWLHIVEEAGEASEEDVSLLIDFLDRLALRQQKKGAIYETNRVRYPVCLLRHDSISRMAWDFWIMVLLFYIAVSVPYSLGLGQSDILDTIDRITDFFFCFDVVLNFRTSFMDRDETVVVDSQRIACKYLKSWFTLDFVSSVPFDVITAGVIPNMTPARLMKIGKIAKVIKLMRLSKVMLLAESELIETLDRKLGGRAHQTFIRIARLAGITFLLAHWLACFGNAVDKSSLDYYFDGIMPSPPQRYLAAMYWAMTTLSTVGYGDITPKSDEERAYAMMAMIVGGSLYGYVIGCVTSIVTETDLNAHAFRERMELFASWLDRHDEIPRVLRVRLKKHFERALAAKAAMDDASVVLELSPELRADTAFYLIHFHVRYHPMFHEIPNSALAKLVEVLCKSHVNAKEYIVRQGDPGIAMYILVSGTARYDQGKKWQPPDTELDGVRFQRVVDGDSFGEEIIFGLVETYCYTIITISDCEFHSITEDAFMERYQNMPELRVQMYAAFLRSRGLGNNGIPRLTDMAERCRSQMPSISRHLLPSMRLSASPAVKPYQNVLPATTEE